MTTVDEHVDRTTALGEAPLGIEQATIDHIPPDQRHGTVRGQFGFWFGAQISIVNIPVGVLAVLFGLNIMWALIACLVGILLGTLFMSFHALQGPRMGVPQMIQTRAQFGYYGSSFLFLATFLLCFGFMAANLVLQAESLTALVSGIPVPAGIIIFAIPPLVLGIWGYNWLHRYLHVMAIVLGIVFVVLSIQMIAYHATIAKAVTSTSLPAFGTFLAVVALNAVSVLTWAPYVSDYSRYLPENVRKGRLFFAVTGGTAIATTLTTFVGVFLGAFLPTLSSSSIPAALKIVVGPWVLIFMGLSLIGANTTDAYTATLSLISLDSHSKWLPHNGKTRAIGVAFFTIVSTGAALLGYHSFLNSYENFLYVMLFLFVPWTAINLTDYYFVRRGQYDVPALFAPNDLYGNFRWRGLIAYVVGLAVQVPFLSQSLYTGPLVKYLGGADISWIIGIVVAAGFYYGITRAEAQQESKTMVEMHIAPSPGI